MEAKTMEQKLDNLKIGWSWYSKAQHDVKGSLDIVVDAEELLAAVEEARKEEVIKTAIEKAKCKMLLDLLSDLEVEAFKSMRTKEPSLMKSCKAHEQYYKDKCPVCKKEEAEFKTK
jgi:hypothetical protein